MSDFTNQPNLRCLDGAPQAASAVSLHAPVTSAVATLPGAIGLAIRVLDSLGTAALVCDGRGRVVLANAAARRLNRDGVLQFGAASGDPGLVTLERGRTRALRRALADAAEFMAHNESGGVVPVPRRAPLPDLLANVAPLAGERQAGFALVLIQDPLDLDTALERQVREAFGATPAEARLGAALARGLTRQEHAAAMGVKASTVKTQLGGLFLKTDTRREADLVRLLLSIPRFARDVAAAERAADVA